MTERRMGTGARLAAPLFCIAGLFATGLAAQDAAVVARDAWVRVPLRSKNETALYLVLENHSAA